MRTYIINFNRLTYLKTMIEWCQANGLDPVVVDNYSTWGPLIDYYATKPCEIIRMPKNWGHTVVWDAQLHLSDARYIVTDPDLDLSGIPSDFLDVLSEGLDRYPLIPKCGFSLEISDLPDSPEGRFIRKVEAGYWLQPFDDRYFLAPIDTTFALYQGWMRHYTLDAIRTNRPYTARHYSWYYTDFRTLPEDEQYYYRTAGKSASGKERLLP